MFGPFDKELSLHPLSCSARAARSALSRLTFSCRRAHCEGVSGRAVEAALGGARCWRVTTTTCEETLGGESSAFT